MNPNDDFKDYGMVRINIQGEYQLNTAYTEITRLHNLLANNQIPHDFHRLYDGWQICYPSDKKHHYQRCTALWFLWRGK